MHLKRDDLHLYLPRFRSTAIMSGNLHRPDPSVYASWPTPNYIDPVRRAWMPPYAGTLQAASTLAVVTRLWLRARKQAGPLGLDDVSACHLLQRLIQATDIHTGSPSPRMAGLNSIYRFDSDEHRAIRIWNSHMGCPIRQFRTIGVPGMAR